MAIGHRGEAFVQGRGLVVAGETSAAQQGQSTGRTTDDGLAKLLHARIAQGRTWPGLANMANAGESQTLHPCRPFKSAVKHGIYTDSPWQKLPLLTSFPPLTP